MPVKLPVNVPAIAPEPVIVGAVNVLFVNVCVLVNWTISLFVILDIFVAVVALPVHEPEEPLALPVKLAVNVPLTVAFPVIAVVASVIVNVFAFVFTIVAPLPNVKLLANVTVPVNVGPAIGAFKASAAKALTSSCNLYVVSYVSIFPL